MANSKKTEEGKPTALVLFLKLDLELVWVNKLGLVRS